MNENRNFNSKILGLAEQCVDKTQANKVNGFKAQKAALEATLTDLLGQMSMVNENNLESAVIIQKQMDEVQIKLKAITDILKDVDDDYWNLVKIDYNQLKELEHQVSTYYCPQLKAQRDLMKAAMNDLKQALLCKNSITSEFYSLLDGIKRMENDRGAMHVPDFELNTAIRELDSLIDRV